MRTLCLTALVVLAASGPVLAGQAEDSEELVKAGVKMRRAGDHAGALEAFTRAHYLHPSGRTLGQMGLAQQSLHQWKRSADSLEVALRSPDAWVLQNRKYLEDALAVVKSHVGWLLVTGPEGSDLYVDEVGAGRLPLREIRLDEGEHVARLEKAGMKSWSTTVAITGGKTTEVTGLLEADNPRVATAVPVAAGLDISRPVSSPTRQNSALLPLIGAGLIGGGVSVVAVGAVVWIQQKRGTYGNFDPGSTGPLLVAGGLAGALAGGVLVYLTRDRPVTAGLNAYGPTLGGRF